MNTSGNKIEKENLYLRVSKRGEITDKIKPLSGEINLDCNYSFIELMLIKLVKEILKEKDFKNLFNNIENQPLSLYQWTTNTVCSTLKNTRKKFLKKLQEQINRYFHDLSNQVIKRSTIRSDLRGNTHRSTTNKSMMKLDSENVKIKYDESMENRIEEKYMKEIGDKYKYKINEMNEKIIILNKETKKIIIDTAVENTLYNIVSEAANGHTDLTEKQRIYFFLDKTMKSIDTSNQNEILKIRDDNEIKEENKNNGINQDIKKEEKQE